MNADKLDKMYDILIEVHGNQKALTEKVLSVQQNCKTHTKSTERNSDRIDSICAEGLPIRMKDWFTILGLFITSMGLIFVVIQAIKK